ncbi:MAG: hypothetical protein IJM79_03145 [Erysipelotrichaceae bacterium]|nr:hypothetical protein [Erysipelotrichaceae bacterium]
MKSFRKLTVVLLAVFMMLTAVGVRAADEGFSDGGEPAGYEPGPVLNEPEDYSGDLLIDEHSEVRSGSLLSSPLRRQLEEDIDTLLNYQPIEVTTVNDVIYAVDDFLRSGGYDHSGDISAILQGSSELAAKANRIGLQQTGSELIEVIETSDNATGYIFVIDRTTVAFRVEDKNGEGIPGALVTISYKDTSGNQVTRSQYTTTGGLPGLCGFDQMQDIPYIMVDVQAENYRAQTILDKRVNAGDILYYRLEDSPENDVYLRCVDLAGKDMLTEDTGLWLVESNSKPLEMRVIVTATGSKSLPSSITLKDNSSERSIAVFSTYSQVTPGGTVSRMFSRTEDWMKQGNLLRQDDILLFDVGGSEQLLEYVKVRNALMQPGTSDEQLPLTGTDKKIPLTDVMGGNGIVNLTVNYLKIPVTIGVFPEGGFIIVATFDIESLSTKYSSLFEESWNPKTRSEGESVLEPFKQEFWRKADRFKSGTGQMNDSKKISLARDAYWSFNASFSLFCSGKYNEKTGNFDGSFGGIFDAKLSGGVTQYFLVSTPIVVPFYLGFNVFGEFKSSISANFLWNKLSDGIGAAFSAADHTLVQRYDLVTGLELYAGIGLKGVCSLEAAGGGTLDFAAVVGTVEEEHKDATRFLIDSFATLRVSGAIAFFSFNLFSKSFGPWRLYDTHPDNGNNGLYGETGDEVIGFVDTDLAATNENGTLLLTGDGEQMSHYKLNSLGLSDTVVNGGQTITALSANTFGDSQVQIVSTGSTTALFRIASINGQARIIYQKQDPVTGRFMDDYYEVPAFRDWDVTEFDVAASTNDKNYFYVGYIVANSAKNDIDSRSKTTWVAGAILDLDNDRVVTEKVKSPLPDNGKYFYYNPRVAGRDDKIAVAYQKTVNYKALDQAQACLFGYNETGEIIMGKGSIFTNGDIVEGEPSFFVTNRSLTDSQTLVIDGYRANGYFDAEHPRCRYYVDVHDYKLSENENYLTNWGYANNTNYAIIASRLYFLEKYPSSVDEYGFGMRMKQVENSEGLINRDQIYEFVVTDDKSGICLVCATASIDVNMETGENDVKGSTLKVYTLEGRYDASSTTNTVILHGPLDIFVDKIDICTFAAVFNRENCAAKGLSVVYACTPEISSGSDGRIINSTNLYQWQQNLKRGMVATDVEFADMFYYTDEHVLPVFITFRNIGYAIEGPIAFTIKDEKGYDLHELYYSEGDGNWHDMGTEVVHNAGRLYSGDVGQIELIVAAPSYWETSAVHEVRVEVAPGYRGDAQISFSAPVFANKLTLQGEQIVIGDHHYADLSITNISGEQLGLNSIAMEVHYKDEAKPAHTSYIDLKKVMSDPDKDKYSVRYDLQPLWDRAEKDGIFYVRFYLVDQNQLPLTGESVFMEPDVHPEVEEVSYEITEGADGIWVKDSGEQYLIRVVRSRFDENCFAHFASLAIDGRELVRDQDYTAQPGSTVLRLKAAALQKLSLSEHEVLISFDDGRVETTLTVVSNEVPDTGDAGSVMLYGAMMLISLAALIGLRKRGKREYN